ncbi:hypothetical protein MVES_000839 [Malassezia vespertilionis]|uniref:Guanylate kinase-like domain-containing protein n=1 Tax=Malassezia vespertilionis TaxID=2020962 RepID=A0A2N1JEM3_9BASI|nr:hypothetical protein MVES_000839 [Malassezia vespertilionis]
MTDTTRHMRPGEVDGKSYYFVPREEFLALVDQGAFLEHAEFGGNLYGTTAKAVQSVQDEQHRRAILDIDTQGVKLIKAHHAYLDPVYVFISPPQYTILKQRLESRNTDTDEAISRRLRMAIHELRNARTPGAFDYIIINDDLDRAYKLLRAVCLGETNGLVCDAMPARDMEEDAAEQSFLHDGETL